MLRVALFTAVLLAAALFLESIGPIVSDEAWLIAGVVAAILLFCIPERGKFRDRTNLIFNLLAVISVYGIFLKVRPWLGDLVGRGLATLLSVFLILGFAGIVLLLPTLTQPGTRTGNSQ